MLIGDNCLFAMSFQHVELLVLQKAWSGAESSCRGAWSGRGHGAGVQKGLVRWRHGAGVQRGLVQCGPGAGSQRDLVQWRPGAHLCCSETLLLCLSIFALLVNIIVIKNIKYNFFLCCFCNRYGCWQSMHIYFLFIVFICFYDLL